MDCVNAFAMSDTLITCGNELRSKYRLVLHVLAASGLCSSIET